MTTQDQIAAQLLHSKSLPISRSWLTNFTTTTGNNQNIPHSALTQTALFRILSSDFRQTLSTQSSTSLLPADVADVSIKERRLHGPIPVQVVDIEDIGSSLWSQVEAIERIEKGEAVRGREIVRTVHVGEDSEERERNAGGGGESGSAAGSGPHRVTVEDAAGTRAMGVEVKRVPEVRVGKLGIGAKMVLKNVTVARGMVLLMPECVTILGGKIEHLDRSWSQSRKLRLMAKIAEMEREENGNANANVDAMEE